MLLYIYFFPPKQLLKAARQRFWQVVKLSLKYNRCMRTFWFKVTGTALSVCMLTWILQDLCQKAFLTFIVRLSHFSSVLSPPLLSYKALNLHNDWKGSFTFLPSTINKWWNKQFVFQVQHLNASTRCGRSRDNLPVSSFNNQTLHWVQGSVVWRAELIMLWCNIKRVIELGKRFLSHEGFTWRGSETERVRVRVSLARESVN